MALLGGLLSLEYVTAAAREEGLVVFFFLCVGFIWCVIRFTFEVY